VTTIPSETGPDVSNEASCKKKKKSYKPVEDILVCKAFMSASQDPQRRTSKSGRLEKKNSTKTAMYMSISKLATALASSLQPNRNRVPEYLTKNNVALIQMMDPLAWTKILDLLAEIIIRELEEHLASQVAAKRRKLIGSEVDRTVLSSLNDDSSNSEED
jgi:hypothetical protein